MRAIAFAACLLALSAPSSASDQERSSRLVVSQSSPSRTTADVRSVVDKHKGGIYSLYARALRSNSTLQGKVALSIVIGPDGTVTKCSVGSSTLNHPDFERQLVERFRSINFGAKGAKSYVNPEYELSFFSAAR